jgi:hypothetical protein
MRFAWKGLVILCAVLVTLFGAGCGGDDGAAQSELDAQRLAELEALEQGREELKAQREQLAALRAQIADPDSIEAPEEGEPPTVEELEIEAGKLEQDISSAASDLGQKLVEFINADPPVAGGELTETQRRAAAAKISEDILVAQEYIDKGGDYKRAITIMESLIPLDPKNQELRDAIAHAEEMRFVTQERFDLVKNGQSQEDVRTNLGPVYLRNIREYPEKNTVAWFYKKEDGGTAAVWFIKRRGEYKVFQKDFEVKDNSDD